MDVKKLTFIGTENVGKTTLIKLLTDQKIPETHDPTIALDFQNLNLNNTKISIWELGGQQQFQFMWDDFIKGSSFICVVSDSTKNNVMETKKIIEKFKEYRDRMIVIANKQDKDGALSTKEIEKMLDIETVGMVAIDKTKKRDLMRILENKIKSL